MSKPIDKKWITTAVVKSAALMIFAVAFWPLIMGLQIIGIGDSFLFGQSGEGSEEQASVIGGVASYAVAAVWLGVAALLFIVSITAFIIATVMSRKHKEANNTAVKGNTINPQNMPAATDRPPSTDSKL